MTQLVAFTAEETDLLVSLPYRVGVWISHADDIEGEADDERESKALHSCIKAIAKIHQEQALIVEIMAETLRRRAQWNDWTENSFHALTEAQKAVAVLRTKGTATDIKHYRAALMEIAASVARAHSEFGAFDEAESEGIFTKIAGAFSSLADADHPTNVSASEDSALSRLAAALRTSDT
jgi:hypothetical protein